MSKSQIFIPKNINVGYNEREDTYTKKLAYIIYYDNKGVLRKETSWQSWRDKKLGNDELENIPTEGFVLNKGVGGQRHSYGWNARNEYIRVYDPRGFEFEISVANLLWILQECTSTKGKGLEGEFIYGWEGKELILIPCETKEYDDCVEYTNMQDGKISARELVVGHTYRDKHMADWIYLGRHMYFSHESKPYNYYGSSWGGRNNDYYKNKYEKEVAAWEKRQKGKKQHIFVSTEKSTYDGKPQYDYPKAMAHLKKCMSDTPVDNYAELLQNFQENCKHAAPFKKNEFFKITDAEYKEYFVKSMYGSNTFYKDGVKCHCETKHHYDNEKREYVYDKNVVLWLTESEYNGRSYGKENWNEISKEEFLKNFKSKKMLFENKYTEMVLR